MEAARETASAAAELNTQAEAIKESVAKLMQLVNGADDREPRAPVPKTVAKQSREADWAVEPAAPQAPG